mmetsp:Transcript_61968/g.157593  ORF Transcript_61968/g.157593 Transcript_61968/m.157593 type:complete len:264 (+) Transcript_61968:109-900(+)
MARLLMLATMFAAPAAVLGDSSCPADADGEGCDADQSSLLTLAKVQMHGGAAAAAEAESNSTGVCNEMLYQGLCYRTCTDMGEMEPRTSAYTCGGVWNSTFAQSCNKDGSSYTGSGMAPGSGSRTPYKCFGDSSNCKPKPVEESPPICTKLPANPWAWPTAAGCSWNCSKGDAKPVLTTSGKELTCSCPMPDKPKPRWVKETLKSNLTTSSNEPCDTGCSKAKGYLMMDGIAYCCPKNTKPSLKKTGSRNGDYLVRCFCGGKA